jgi:hypothetical protein
MSTNPVSGGSELPKPPESDLVKREAIPQRLLKYSLSFLDEESIRNAALVNKTFHKVAVEGAAQEQWQIVRETADFLLSQDVIQKHRDPSIVASLKALTENNDVLKSVNLVQIKKNQLAALKILSDQIAKLDKKELLAIKKAYPIGKHSKSLGLLLHALYSPRIEAARSLPDVEEQGMAFWHVVTEICRLGNLEVALEIAKQTPGHWKEGCLTSVIGDFVRRGEIDRAFREAEKENYPSQVMAKIATTLVTTGHLDRGLKVLKDFEITKLDLDITLGEIINHLIKDPRTREEALRLAREHTFTHEGNVKMHYQTAAFAYLKEGNLTKAIEVAGKAPDKFVWDLRRAVSNEYSRMKKEWEERQKNKAKTDKKS